MPEMDFEIINTEVERYAVQPLLDFGLRIRNSDQGLRILNVMLQCQVRIEATRRSYTPSEQSRLSELFGPPELWSRSLNSLLWTHVNATIPPFREETTIRLQVPCSYDFNLAVTKYLYGIEAGEIPLLFLFSGTVFYENEQGIVQLDPISWNQEASWRLPLQTWQELMDHYYPDKIWLHLSRNVFDRIYQYKREHGFLTWEQAIENLLQAREEIV